jgi:mannose-6-phosphate isomerase-like protein (cupin superfamily)
MTDEHLIHGYVVGPHQGVPGGGPEVKASGRSTGGSLTVIEIVVDGQGPPRHTHTREDESLYVFTGTLAVECGKDRFEAGPGSFVFLPRDLAHTFRSVGGAATGLLIVAPGGLDQYFAELHAVLTTSGDRSEIAKVQAKYGIVRS